MHKQHLLSFHGSSGGVLLAAACLLVAAGLVSCGGGGGSSGSTPAPGGPQPISVSVTPDSPSVQVSQTQAFSATLQNDAQNKGVTWSLSGCTSGCGTLTNQTAASVTYNAPVAVPVPATVNLTATSISDNTKSRSVVITVTPGPPGPISVSVTPDSPLVQISQTQAFSATLQNDAQNNGVTWSLPAACTAACGTLTGGTSTAVTYNAPASVPAPATITLTAASISDNTKSQSIVITVTAVPLFTDDFDRADANPINPTTTWLNTGAGGGAIVNEQLTGGAAHDPVLGGGDNFIFVNTTVVPAFGDQYTRITFVSTANSGGTQSDSGGPMVRADANGNGWLFDWISNWPTTGQSTWTIYKVIGTVGHLPPAATGTLGRALVGGVGGDVVEIRAVGNVITGYLNGSAVPGATTTDSTYPTGGFGMHLFSNTGRWENFEGGAL
jgi:hypothetical protein